MLSHEVAKRYGQAGLPSDTIQVKFTGTADRASALSCRTASPSSCAAKATITSARACAADASHQAAGGSQAGRAREHHRRQHRVVRRHFRRVLFQCVAGERFAVRNSGAIAVVEAWAITVANT